MGNQQGKQQGANQQQQQNNNDNNNNDNNDNNKQLTQENKKSPRNNNNKSNNMQSNNNINNSKNRISNNNSKNSKNSKKNNNKQQQPQLQQQQQQQQQLNQFMPMLKLGQQGQSNLHINLLVLIKQKQKQPKQPNKQYYLSRNSSDYAANLSYTQTNNSQYRFQLEQQGGTTSSFIVDLQGNCSNNNSNDLWIMLCPINIPFGKMYRMGQFQCLNIYEKYQKLQGQQQLKQQQYGEQKGPSLKNIDIQLQQQVYYKWGQQPKNKGNNNNNVNSKKQQQFVQYKQISKYFDMKNSWKASTFIEYTKQYFRVWLISNQLNKNADKYSKDVQTTKLLDQINRDIKKRESQYIQTIYRIVNKI